jgi:hypothetical protein
MKRSGECTPIVGCSDDGGFHALKRTPATNWPGTPVGVIGSVRPLQVMACRSGTKPVARACSRSTDEST